MAVILRLEVVGSNMEGWFALEDGNFAENSNEKIIGRFKQEARLLKSAEKMGRVENQESSMEKKSAAEEVECWVLQSMFGSSF